MIFDVGERVLSDISKTTARVLPCLSRREGGKLKKEGQKGLKEGRKEWSKEGRQEGRKEGRKRTFP